jgi:hypothetical protein
VLRASCPPLPFRVTSRPSRLESLLFNPQSSILNPQSSIINHQSSIINHQSLPHPLACLAPWRFKIFLFNPQSSILNLFFLLFPWRAWCLGGEKSMKKDTGRNA